MLTPRLLKIKPMSACYAVSRLTRQTWHVLRLLLRCDEWDGHFFLDKGRSRGATLCYSRHSQRHLGRFSPEAAIVNCAAVHRGPRQFLTEWNRHAFGLTGRRPFPDTALLVHRSLR